MREPNGDVEAETASHAGMPVLVANTLYALTEGSEGLSIRQLAEATQNSRSSTHRILKSLARAGFVRQTVTGSYVIGSRLVRLAARVFGTVPVLQIANLTMRELVEEIGETCYLALYSETERLVTYVHRIEGRNPVRFVQPIGVRMPLHAGAVGKAILAEFPNMDLETLDLHRYTQNTLTNIAALRAELKRICKQGYATSIEERVEGVAGAAAVIRSANHVVGALTVSIPVSRIKKPEQLQTIGQIVKKYADELSLALTATGIERI
jgi:IclR family acetate operon transcriptional repressor